MQIQPILRELCPRCHKGKIFRGPLWRTYLAMYERCPECGLQYEREQGYFLGAMYFSYALSIPPVLVLVLLLWWLTPWRFDVVLVAAFVGYLPFVPAVTRFARVLCSIWTPLRSDGSSLKLPCSISWGPGLRKLPHLL
jgi:uncharacterized protein (DUF983 family)